MPELGAMVVVQRHDGKILLTQREDFAVWCLPGGAVDPGESPAAAALREVREETGLAVQLTRLVALITRPNAGRFDRMLLVFAATPVGGSFAPDPHEVIDLGFFPPDALPEPMMLEHGEMVAEAVRGSSGQVWLSTRRMPAQFADRAALYRWRDESGLSRPEAYQTLTRMMGELTFTCVVGGAATLEQR